LSRRPLATLILSWTNSCQPWVWRFLKTRLTGPHFSLLLKRLCNSARMVNVVASMNCHHLPMSVGVEKAPITTATNIPKRSSALTRTHVELLNVPCACTKNISKSFEHVI
jgi:hypothetical protein